MLCRTCTDSRRSCAIYVCPTGRTANGLLPIRAFADAVNAQCVKTIKLGTDVCIDESMSKWRGRGGKDGKRAFMGLPHVTKIKRCGAVRGVAPCVRGGVAFPTQYSRSAVPAESPSL
jgi:hypothetical protein